MSPHRLRRHRPQADRLAGQGGGAGAAGLHRAAPELPQPRGSACARGASPSPCPPARRSAASPCDCRSGWQEAEVVERQAARQIYEDFLHRKQDPALLEKKAGNEFRARIFPIPANGDQGDQDLLLPGADRSETALPAPPQGPAADRDARDLRPWSASSGQQAAASSLGGVTVSHKVVRVSKTNFAPDRDFVVPVQSPHRRAAPRQPGPGPGQPQHRHRQGPDEVPAGAGGHQRLAGRGLLPAGGAAGRADRAAQGGLRRGAAAARGLLRSDGGQRLSGAHRQVLAREPSTRSWPAAPWAPRICTARSALGRQPRGFQRAAAGHRRHRHRRRDRGRRRCATAVKAAGARGSAGST